MEFLVYFGVMYLYMLSPGPCMALISRNSAKFGFSKIHFTILGIMTSITFYTILAIVGIGALIQFYPKAFKIFKMIGSCYIIYIGVRMFLASFVKQEMDIKQAKKATRTKEYLIGLTTDLANPLTIVGITSIILGVVKVTSPLSDKIIFFIVTIMASFCYAYTYAFIFGNPVSRKFITPKMNTFEKVAGIAVSMVGTFFLINTINL